MGILEKLTANREYRGFTIKLNLEESRYETSRNDVKISKYKLEQVQDAIDEYWNARALNFPTAQDLGIKKGDRMYTAKGEEVTVISTERIPMTRNQIAVRTNEGAMYICADSLSPRNK